MKKYPILIILLLSNALFSEPIRMAYNIDITEKSDTRIVFDLSFNPQYDWTETDSSFGIFFGIPRDAEYSIRLLNNTGFINDDFNIFETDEIGIMRGIRIGLIEIFPFGKDKINSYTNETFTFELTFSKPYSIDESSSPAFDRIYNSCLLNPPPPATIIVPGRYLIISAPTFITQANLIGNWKKNMGYDVNTISTTFTGNSRTQIRNYILSAYNNSLTRPDYVMLIGDVSFPTGTLPDYGYSGYISDQPYACIDGSDYLPDIFVGRLAIDTQPEATVIASKIINYEKEPYMADTNWFVRGVAVSTYLHAISPVLSVMYFREILLRNSFAQVDTFFEGSGTITPSMISSVINGGVSFVDYRGWAGSGGWWEPGYSVSNVYALRNTNMTPIVTSIVCGTGDYGDSYEDPCFGEAWIRAGTATAPRGGVAFFGATDHNTHTRYNNPINEGFYFGLFDNNLETMGECVLAGKMELYARMVHERDGIIGQYFYTYNMIADPGLIIRTEVPHLFNINTITTISKNGGFIPFEINDAGTNTPVDNGWISIYTNPDSFKAFNLSDINGMADLFVPELRSDTLYYTITKRNYKAYSGYILVQDGEYNIRFFGATIDDGNSTETSGNRDSVFQAGERVNISIRFNSSSMIHSPIISIDSPENAIRFENPVFGLRQINEGENIINARAEIGENISNGFHPVYMRIIGDSGYDSQISFYVKGEKSFIGIENIIIADTIGTGDGDMRLELNEDAQLWVEITNNSSIFIDTLCVIYSIKNGYLNSFGTDTLRFISLLPSDTKISTAPITVKLSPYTIGNTTIPMDFYYINSNKNIFIQTYDIATTFNGRYTNLGPDDYGYIALNNMSESTNPQTPIYSWKEISSDGIGRLILSSDDTIEVLTTPFPFVFYGKSYDKISLSSNGWFAPDSVPSYLYAFYNLPIPHPGGPFGIIAPYWDDLSPHSGGVYYLYDEINHLFIFEWHNVPHASTGQLQTFEVIIYDSRYHYTITGDCPILFQYLTVNDNDAEENYSTVGIASPNLYTGIEYVYSRIYPSGIPEIQPNLSIKFTTSLGLGNISGNVILSDGTVAKDVMVCVSGQRCTHTDLIGNYYLRMIPSGEKIVYAKQYGYKTGYDTISVFPDSLHSNINFNLEKVNTPIGIIASKNETQINVSIICDGSYDTVNLYRSNFQMGSKKLITQITGDRLNYVDSEIVAGAKYYYFASIIENGFEGELFGPDSGWIQYTTIVDNSRPYEYSIEVYPSPFNAEFNIIVNGSGNARIMIYNVLGQKVYTEKILTPIKHNINFIEKSSGLYFIAVQWDNGNRQFKRLLLMK